MVPHDLGLGLSPHAAIVPMDHSGSSTRQKLIMDNVSTNSLLLTPLNVHETILASQWLRKNLVDPLKPGVQLIVGDPPLLTHVKTNVVMICRPQHI